MPAGGGTSQTAVVRAVGGRTQVTSLVTAAIAAAAMLVLAPLLGLLPQVVLIDFSRVFDIEYTALKMLIDGEKSTRGTGVTLWLAGMNPAVRQCFRMSGFVDELGPDRLFPNARSGLQRFLDEREE